MHYRCDSKHDTKSERSESKAPGEEESFDVLAALDRRFTLSFTYGGVDAGWKRYPCALGWA